MTMLSMRWMTAIMVMAVTVSALSLLADRNVETSVLLAAVAAVLGVLTVTVFLLAEIVDAVQAIARDNSAKHSNEVCKDYDDAVTLEPHAHHLRMTVAAIDFLSRSKGGANAPQNQPTNPRNRTNIRALGSHVDIVIPFNRQK
jgi:hypothetical protein